MKTIKTTLLLLMTIITFYDGRGEDNEIDINSSYIHQIPIEKIKDKFHWIGMDIGTPGLININTGIYLRDIGLQLRGGVLYPYYRTLEIGLMADYYTKFVGYVNIETKFGYLEHEEDIYRMYSIGFSTSPIIDDLFFNFGLTYFTNNDDLLFPVMPNMNIGYRYKFEW